MNPDSQNSLGKRLPKQLRVEASSIGISGKKWWEDDELLKISKTGPKWQYLEHNGVSFPKDYEYRGVKLKYDGEQIKLTKQQEEIIYFWCQTIGTDWEQKKIYRKNVENLISSTFSSPKKLEKFDFKPMLSQMKKEKEEKEKIKEARKLWSQTKKQEEKRKKLLKDNHFGFAIVDNMIEKRGGYVIEPPTLFKGRGAHPRSGCLKVRTCPEDLTINCAEDAPVPKCMVPGRAWGEVVHNNEVTWLAYYKDENTSSYKYMFLAANSKFKALSDMLKYEKARKLKNFVENIRTDYWEKINNNGNRKENQIGIVSYFIDRLALRVGNEKNDEKEADTVGCCSLRVEHVSLLEENQVEFNFLGKDSMEYKNTIKVEDSVYKRLNQFIQRKKPEEDLFEMVNPTRLNEYFQSLMEGLTAKVFRTFNASSTLEKELYSDQNFEKMTEEEKYKFYNDANKAVAILCNHQKTVNKSFDERMEKNKEKLQDLEDYLKQLKKHVKMLKAGKKGLTSKSSKSDKGKVARKFPANLKSARDQMAKLKTRFEKESLKIQEKEDNKNVALGTSKTNYNDPRISVAFCKRAGLPIERVFSKELRSKFTWAMATIPEWKF